MKKKDNDLTKELFLAYYDCRKNKRNTVNAKKFEMNYERNLFSLRDDILERKYKIGKSVVFIIEQPVKREIFAADFRDRIIHHFLINKINHLFEQSFIEDSYACRKNKGNLYGIKRVQSFIKECSKDYKEDCFILKMDIQGFFMNINKNILLDILTKFINEKYHKKDKSLVLYLIEKVLENDPRKNCIIKGKKSDWNNLPPNKSLFNVPEYCGLPIGNLTSQIFANLYLNHFDKYIKEKLNINFYGRYVDDFIIIQEKKEKLLSLIPQIRNFLKTELHLTLHHKKIYIQHYSKGVAFLGAYIKPNRIYIKNNIKGNFYEKIKNINKLIENKIMRRATLTKVISIVNSYLGLFRNFKTHKLRTKFFYFLNDKNNFFKKTINKINMNKRIWIGLK